MKMLNKKSLMKAGYALVVAATILVFLACAESRDQVKKTPKIKAHHHAASLAIKAKTPDEISAITESQEPLDSVALVKASKLKERLVINGVPGKWFDEQLKHETFQIHSTIDLYFHKSAEKQVDYDKKRDASWYFAQLAVDAKIEKGKKFIGRSGVINAPSNLLLAGVCGFDGGPLGYPRGSDGGKVRLLTCAVLTDRKA